MLLVVVFGGGVSAPFLREDVHHDGTFFGTSGGRRECVLQLAEVVAVDGAHVANSQRLEECGWLEILANAGLDCLEAALGLWSEDGKIM